MPLTQHGRRTLQRFRREYGPRRGEAVFYATANSDRQGGRGRIGGQRVDRPRRRRQTRRR